jgi:hypothetical protein
VESPRRPEGISTEEGTGMTQPSHNIIPTLDDIIGHWFDDFDVHIIFCDPDGRQFFLGGFR